MKDIQFKEWIEKVENILQEAKNDKEFKLTKADKTELKKFYEKYQNRQSELYTRRIINIFRNRKTEKFIVLGFNKTAKGLKMLVTLNKETGEFISLTGDFSDITGVKALDIIEASGNKWGISGIIEIDHAKIVGISDTEILEQKAVEIMDKLEEKYIYKYQGSVVCYPSLDFDSPDYNPKEEDKSLQPKLPIINEKNEMSFAMYIYLPQGKLVFYFRETPIEFFNGCIEKEDFSPNEEQNLKKITSAFSTIPMYIPCYFGKKSLTGNGIIFNPNAPILTEKEQKEVEEAPIDNIVEKTYEIIQKYGAMDFGAIAKELKMEAEDFETLGIALKQLIGQRLIINEQDVFRVVGKVKEPEEPKTEEPKPELKSMSIKDQILEGIKFYNDQKMLAKYIDIKKKCVPGINQEIIEKELQQLVKDGEVFEQMIDGKPTGAYKLA